MASWGAGTVQDGRPGPLAWPKQTEGCRRGLGGVFVGRGRLGVTAFRKASLEDLRQFKTLIKHLPFLSRASANRAPARAGLLLADGSRHIKRSRSSGSFQSGRRPAHPHTGGPYPWTPVSLPPPGHGPRPQAGRRRGPPGQALRADAGLDCLFWPQGRGNAQAGARARTGQEQGRVGRTELGNGPGGSHVT